MNLERQIKRHITGSRHNFFALASPGFESVSRQELEQLSDTVDIGQTIKGGINFSGRLIDLLKANLNLRTVGRILMRLRTFKATNFRQLVDKTRAIRWSLYLPAGAVPVCKVTAHRSRLYHSQAIDQRIRQAIAEYWQAMDVAPGLAPEQKLFIRLNQDVVTLSLDSSGDNLYRRGLKRHSAQAPLRETIAAGILQYARFHTNLPLIDPMCGAGTFSIEAALMAKQIAPGLQRAFAFAQWPGFKPRQWKYLLKDARQNIRSLSQPMIWSSDIDSDTCDKLSKCVKDNGLEDAIRVMEKDFFSLNPRCIGTQGLVVLNPPYGHRLDPKGPNKELTQFYKAMVDKLKQDFKNWYAALLIPHSADKILQSLSLNQRPLVHGGLLLTLFTGKIA